MDQNNVTGIQHDDAGSAGSIPASQEITSSSPVAVSERIKSIDTIRGVALLGILMMNIPGFGINNDFWYPLLTGPCTGKDFYTFAIVFVFFEGTMRGLFSMLFGAGMVLFMQNKRALPDGPSVSELYYRRLLWLVLFGLINAYVFLWQGDILFFYGLLGMLLFPFRAMKPKWLVVFALACVSFGMIKSQWSWNETREKRQAYNKAMTAKKDSAKLSDEQQSAIAEWTEVEKNAKPDTTYTNRNLRKMSSNYGTIFTYFIPMNSSGEAWYTYHGAWDMLAMMLLGMALFSWGFFTNKLQTSTYIMWLLVGYGIGIPIAWVIFDGGFMGMFPPGQYTDRFRSSHQVFVEFRRILLTIGHASLVMLIFRSGALKWLMKAMSNVGQMAFTNYLMQSIICTLFFYGYGLGYYNKLRFHELYYVVFAVWIFQLIFSSIWLGYFRFGPFEWLWRSLTYWKKQPMKK